MQSSIEQFIRMRIREIAEDLINIPTRYPDTYGQALVNWRRSTHSSQKENIDR